MARSTFRPGAQRGAVLIVGLLLLLVLTMLGVTSMRSAMLEERMTGNVQDNVVAFQAAEAGLREGELLLQSPVLPDFNGTNGLYQAGGATQPPRWTTIDWTSSTAVRSYAGMADAPGSLPKAQARYFIEEMPTVVTPGESLGADVALDEQGFYRVTAKAVGVGGSATAMVQSSFKR